MGLIRRPGSPGATCDGTGDEDLSQKAKEPSGQGVETGEARFAALLAALAADPAYAGIVAAYEAGKGGRKFGSNGLKVSGKIFAMLVEGKLVVKLPRHRVEALVASRQGEPFDPGHGRLMKEWVVIAGPQPSWLDLARHAHDFVARPRAREEAAP